VLKLLSDENFNGDILRGIFRRRPNLDVVRGQDVGLKATLDAEILDWAATAGRIVLTHDRETMVYAAYGECVLASLWLVSFSSATRCHSAQPSMRFCLQPTAFQRRSAKTSYGSSVVRLIEIPPARLAKSWRRPLQLYRS
jgi:hypothetical protein